MKKYKSKNEEKDSDVNADEDDEDMDDDEYEQLNVVTTLTNLFTLPISFPKSHFIVALFL